MSSRKDESDQENDQLMQSLSTSLVKQFPHSLHAPFRVTSEHGHAIGSYDSLETALERAFSLGPGHFIVDKNELQVWGYDRVILRNREK